MRTGLAAAVLDAVPVIIRQAEVLRAHVRQARAGVPEGTRDPAPAEPAAAEAEAPGEYRDPEGGQPLRAAFARYLDPADVAEFTELLQARYRQRLNERGSPTPTGSTYTRERLLACARDLRLTAAVLAAAGREEDEDILDWSDSLLSILARPRAVEVEACAERVERAVAWCVEPFSEDLGKPALEPEVKA